MSLLETLNECPDTTVHIYNILPNDLPYKDEIINNKFNIPERELVSLIKSLKTYSFLNIDATEVVREIVWKIGRLEVLFYEYFGKYNDKYIVRTDIDKVIYHEFKRVYPREYNAYELGCRFLDNYNYEEVAGSGNLRLLKWLNITNFRPELFRSAIEGGNIEMLEWLLSKQCPWKHIYFNIAAKNGNLDILKWAITKDLYFSENICEHAAEGCHLEILKWLKNNGYNINEKTFSSVFSEDRPELNKERLQLAKWLRLEKCPWDVSTFTLATMTNDMEILRWLHSEKCPWDASTFSTAVLTGNMDMLNWMKSEECPWDEMMYWSAAFTGNYDILNWLISWNCPYNTSACAGAAQAGNLEVLKWLRWRNFPWDAFVYVSAVKGGSFDILEWLRIGNCPWNPRVCIYPIMFNKPDIYIWMRNKFSFGSLDDIKLTLISLTIGDNKIKNWILTGKDPSRTIRILLKLFYSNAFLPVNYLF